MNSSAEDADRSPITIVGGVDDKLCVDSEVQRSDAREIIIGLADQLGAWMRQTPVTNKDSQPARRKEPLACR